MKAPATNVRRAALGTVALIMALVPVLGRPAAGAATPGVTEDRAVAAYWTPERMRAAKPIEESPAYRAAVARYAASEQAGRPATSGVARSFPPAAGTLTAPSGPGTAVIAGHCTHSGGPGGALVSNFAFVPAFDDDLVDPRPFGTWTALRLIPAPGWTARTDFGEDMSVAVMNTLNGHHIVTLLGGQGLQVNQGLSVPENAFGYPAEAPFDGGNLLRCPGTSSPESPGATQTFKIPCDMTRGSSGGGWLHSWDGNVGFLNGVVSRIDRIVGPTISVSPLFDDPALTLFNQTRNL